MTFEDILMQRSREQQKRLDLKEEVAELQEILEAEQNLNQLRVYTAENVMNELERAKSGIFERRGLPYPSFYTGACEIFADDIEIFAYKLLLSRNKKIWVNALSIETRPGDLSESWLEYSHLRNLEPKAQGFAE